MGSIKDFKMVQAMGDQFKDMKVGDGGTGGSAKILELNVDIPKPV